MKTSDINRMIDSMSRGVTPENISVGRRYNWKYQPERLVYLGKVGYWHQFAKVGDPSKVWCEVTDLDLIHFELTPFKEQIKHLYGKALDKAVPDTWSYLTSDQVEKVVEIFADLLIRESIEVVDRNTASPNGAHALIKHFGVQE